MSVLKDKKMSKIILVVASHSDDEALGCGGTIARHVKSGDKVHLIFMTNGVGSRNVKIEEVDRRKSAAQKSADILEASSIQQFDFPDNKMDTIALLDVVKAIEEVIDKLQPEIIYTHHIGDLNIDHQITHKALITACRPQSGFCVKEIYTFEIPSSTEWNTPGVEPFSPNVYIDITDYIDIKKQALEVYSKEMRQPPHSRSIDNTIRLNALRGNSVGVDYAEAFMLIRMSR
jgi:LmbE family N-acetylglucosaminyl deacetylase